MNLFAMTPNKDAEGNVRVAGLPLFLGRGFAKRPWKLPKDSDRSKTGTNLFRWARPEKEKGPLTIMVYEDKRKNKTLISVVPTIFIGEKGVLYSAEQTAIDKGGPFVDLVLQTGALAVKKINIVRQKAKPIELNAKKEGTWKTTLQSVSDHEPLTITIIPGEEKSPIKVNVDCCYRSAKKGAVIYTVMALTPKR